MDIFSHSVSLFADTSAAITAMREYVAPTVRTLAALAGIICSVFIVNAGYLYMTSAGNPQQLMQAKHVLKTAFIGLFLVFGATALVSIMTNAYNPAVAPSSAVLPSLESIQPKEVSNGLVDVLIKAVTGFLSNIIQAVGAPFLAALEYFTKATPLMAANATVFNLWLAVVALTNVLFVVVLALLGMHVMSASTLGFDEIDIKHLLPRIGMIFILINCSIFIIDSIIKLSNVLIEAIGKVSGASSVWTTLTGVVEQTSGVGLAALLLMLAFLIFSVVLLVYYVGRLVTLFIGAVLSPLILLIWLLPGFRDFSETAIKSYLSTIFVLFVHVVILLLSASLFTGLATDNSDTPNTLMALVVGLATIIALLKTQGIMMQYSYVSLGARNSRRLGGQFINGVSYLSGRSGSAVRSSRAAKDTVKSSKTIVQGSSAKAAQPQVVTYQTPKSQSPGVTITKNHSAKPSVTNLPDTPQVSPRNLKTPKGKQ